MKKAEALIPVFVIIVIVGMFAGIGKFALWSDERQRAAESRITRHVTLYQDGKVIGEWDTIGYVTFRDSFIHFDTKEGRVSVSGTFKVEP